MKHKRYGHAPACKLCSGKLIISMVLGVPTWTHEDGEIECK